MRNTNNKNIVYGGVIYCVISPSNKKYYGFTYDLVRRKRKHEKDAQIKKNRFYNAIKKYGFENFRWEIVETYCDKNRENIKRILCEREIFWIKHDKTYLPEFGYNMTLGGNGGDTFTNMSAEDKEKTRQRFRESSSGINNPMYGKTVYEIWCNAYGKEVADKKMEELKRNIGNSHKGMSHPCSEQTKEKISKKLMGRKISKENLQKRMGNKNASGKRSDESRQKMSKSHTGLPSNRKGKHASQETKDKISRAKSGVNNHNYGKHFTDEHKKKISDSHKKRIELLRNSLSNVL